MKNNRAALALSALGALMVVFGFVMWSVNTPDYSRMMASCTSMGQPGTKRYEDCTETFTPIIASTKNAYNSCLFSSRYQACAAALPVPYLTIGGILLLLSGMGLFAFGALTRPARA